jgi:hypothetical protein
MSSPDLSTATPSSSRRAAAVARPSLVSRLVTRYVDGWTWYARNGSPPAPEPGYPSRRLDVIAACTSVARRTTPRFALLFGAAR